MKSQFFLVVYSFCLVTADAQTINLSHDLIRLGIATQNLPPDSPSIDARPLFQAALQYAQNHPTQMLTLDHGAYYFLTTENSNTYLHFASFSNLSVDLAGSTIYLAGAFLQGFAFSDCQHVTLTNFQIDFLNPPNTYVRLASVNPDQRTLVYTTLPGRVDPATFNGVTAPSGPLVLWAVAFRNDQIVPGTSRMEVAQPIANNVLRLVQDNTPWTQSATLSTLQPGDTIVVTQRGGSPPINVTRGDSIIISNGIVHGASAIAVLLNSVSNSTVNKVNVIPGRGNLISSNADGIHFINTGANNHIRNCFVTRTLDDALVMDSYDLATVASISGSRQITVNRTAYLRFSNGAAVNFVDPLSTDEVSGATIISQDPPDSNSPVFDGPVVLTFDRGLPTLSSGFGMVFANPDQRGEGSSIEDNRVGEVPFGRGIWIGGSEGVTIQGNEIGHTSNGGIVVFEDTKSYPVPPAHDIIIRNNLIIGSLGPMASGSGTQIAVGSVIVDSINNIGAFASSPVNSNIAIEANDILDSGRSGIWVGELNGGTIRDNLIIGYDRYPELPLFGVSLAEKVQLLEDFTHAVVIHYSQNVSATNNCSCRYPGEIYDPGS